MEKRPEREMSQLLTTPQIAEFLQVSPRTIKDWIHMGFIPHFKINRSVRFSKEAIMRWLEEREVKGRKSVD